jgi:hypothetical protein
MKLSSDHFCPVSINLSSFLRVKYQSHLAATGGLRRAIASLIFPIAVCSVDSAAAYEMRTPLSSPNASPGTSATYNTSKTKTVNDLIFQADAIKVRVILTSAFSNRNMQRDSESLIVPKPSTSDP